MCLVVQAFDGRDWLHWKGLMECKFFVFTVSFLYNQPESSNFVPSCILLTHPPGHPARRTLPLACFEAPGTYNMYLGQAALLNLHGSEHSSCIWLRCALSITADLCPKMPSS